MKKKMVAMIMTVALVVLPLVGCTEQTGEAEADAGVVYEVVGGISEPTRVWNEVVETPEVEVAEEEAYAPDVLPMEPTAFVTNKTADTLTSDKDGEVIATLEEGTELTLVGTTGKGYYQTEDGAFISASDVEKVVAEEEPVEQVAETTTQSNTTPATTTTTPAEQPTQQESQPEQEQTPVAEQETPAPAPEPTPQPTPEPEPTPQPTPDYTVYCGICHAGFYSDEECDAHYYSTHYDSNQHSTVGCSHPNAWEDENGMLYCPDCGGYVSHNG